MKYTLFAFMVFVLMGSFFSSPLFAESKGEEDSTAAYMKGKEYILKGEHEKALPYLEQAHRVDPNSSTVNFQLAEIHLRLRNIEQAEVYGKKAVESEPDNVEFRNALAGIYASLKKYDEAKAQYQKIIELEPNNAKAPLLMGIIEAERGRLSEGVDILSKLIQVNPDNYMALFYRARMYLEQNNEEKAKSDLDRALTLKPNFTEAGTALGLIFEKAGQNEEAIKAYSRVQGTGSFKKRLAQLLLQSNQTEKALQELLEYEKAEPDDFTARIKIGLIYFEKKDYVSAQKVFEKILKEEPQADNVRFYYAWVLEESKKLNPALDEFRKVKKDSNFYRESSLHIGYILKEQKKFDEGIKFSKALLEKEPETEEFHDMYATFLDAKKQHQKALEVVDKALVTFPKSEKLNYFKGVLHEKLGNKSAAIAAMKTIFAINPENYHALNFVGYLYSELGENLVEAEELIRKAAKIKPNDGFIEDSLGWVLFKQGKIKESQEALERAAALQPEEAIIFEHLGDLYSHQKEFKKAKEFYKKAVSLSISKDKDLMNKVQQKLAALPKEDSNPSTEEEKRVPTASGGDLKKPRSQN